MKRKRTPHRKPKQARAHATIEAILGATAQILEQKGEAMFNTNRIAERAGISIGSLYQYFPNKRAILREIAARETRALHKAARGMPSRDKDKQFVLRLIGAFKGQPRLRQIVVKTLTADVADLPAEKLSSDVDSLANLFQSEFQLSRLDGYILSRAVIGVVRAAVIEGSTYLHQRKFADALVALIRLYTAGRIRP